MQEWRVFCRSVEYVQGLKVCVGVSDGVLRPVQEDRVLGMLNLCMKVERMGECWMCTSVEQVGESEICVRVQSPCGCAECAQQCVWKCSVGL